MMKEFLEMYPGSLPALIYNEIACRRKIPSIKSN